MLLKVNQHKYKKNIKIFNFSIVKQKFSKFLACSNFGHFEPLCSYIDCSYKKRVILIM